MKRLFKPKYKKKKGKKYHKKKDKIKVEKKVEFLPEYWQGYDNKIFINKKKHCLSDADRLHLKLQPDLFTKHLYLPPEVEEEYKRIMEEKENERREQLKIKEEQKMWDSFYKQVDEQNKHMNNPKAKWKVKTNDKDVTKNMSHAEKTLHKFFIKRNKKYNKNTKSKKDIKKEIEKINKMGVQEYNIFQEQEEIKETIKHSKNKKESKKINKKYKSYKRNPNKDFMKRYMHNTEELNEHEKYDMFKSSVDEILADRLNDFKPYDSSDGNIFVEYEKEQERKEKKKLKKKNMNLSKIVI